jgi:hypothetical protein
MSRIFSQDLKKFFESMDIAKSILNALVLTSLFSRDKNLNSRFSAEVLWANGEKII